MRLANRVLLCALAIFVLCAFASAQTLRPENDPRNQAPSVGTGGQPGGPTGLFTIYDGDTLRRGEFTFSIAYSNYDRDPGNVDITVVPLSFNIGINDHLELFYSTEGYRGVKVNNPKNLSSFYLPNSQLFFGVGILGSGAAIVQAPVRVSGPTLTGNNFFRPAFNQPFVQFPFVGQRGPNFGLTGGPISPAFVSTLGPANGGDSGNWGAASNFPGYGSPCGSILPGVVLTTQTIPANLTFNTLTVPSLFTTCPTYIADAPFINRLYGESAFGTMQAGAKVRFTGPNNPLGLSLVGFYRWYTDSADDFSGFNQLQRGASPGGSFGDIGVVGIVSGRLSRSISLHANIGYILNSNPKSEAFGGGDATLLDRADELVSGIGIDLVPNKFWQGIIELKSVHYVGGRTPNSFSNNPIEFVGGLRAYPRRWWGVGAWYREHLNAQGQRTLFSDAEFPAGFTPSNDPHGFGFQIFAGHRNERLPAVLPNQAPVISSFAAANSTITLPCAPGTHSSSGNCPANVTNSVAVTTAATDPDGDTLLYTYSATGGRITGDGPNATWDLSGMAPGTYTASVEVDDGCGCVSFSSTTVTIQNCPDCVPDLVCPTVTVSCSDMVDAGAPATFTATFTQGTPTVSETYNWTVSAGTITSGQGTSSITVDTTNLGGQSITATVEVGGVDPSCNRTASCTTPVRPRVEPRKFDEYGNIRFNDEKARLDNYAIQLQNEPSAQGLIIAYGSCDGEGLTRGNRAKDYLVNTRGIDASRLSVVDGGCRSELKVELWIVPSGATAPAADTSGAVSPCPECKRPTRRRRGRGEE